MKTNVEKISETKVKLTVTVDAEALQKAKNIALVRVGKKVKAPGFRVGKAPTSVVAKHANPNEVAEEQLNTALNAAIIEAFTTEKLRPLDRPNVEVKKYVPEESLEFTAEVDVYPEVKLLDLKKLTKPTQKAVKITKKEIDEVLEKIQMDMATRETVERTAKDGDEVVVDFTGKENGVEFDGGKAEKYPLTLGSSSFIPGFEEAIVGHSAGEEFDIPLSFPKDYHVKKLAGSEVVFTVKLHEVKEIKKAELTDELAVKAGNYKNLDELKIEIKTELKQKQEMEQSELAAESVLSQLIKESEIPVPETLLNDQLNSMKTDLEQNVKYRAISANEYVQMQGYENVNDWVEKMATPKAKDSVKVGLALTEVANQLNLEINDAELAESIGEYKNRYAYNPEMAKRFDEKNVQESVRQRLRSEKASKKLVEMAKEESKVEKTTTSEEGVKKAKKLATKKAKTEK